MLSDNDADCLATALALCLKNEQNCRWIKEWHKQRPQYLLTP